MDMSDDELRQHAVGVLKAATATTGDLELLSFKVARWGGGQSTPTTAAAAAVSHSGACAHLTAPGEPRDMALLSAPIKARVFFAGEVFHHHRYLLVR